MIGKEKSDVPKYNRRTGFASLKFVLVFIFILTIFFPLISAVEVEMNSQFDSGETLLAKISGNFVDSITKNNVEFYRGHVQIPIEFGIQKVENDFYIYALLLGKNEGNYSIKIKDVRYYKATQVVDDDIVSNFTISNETARFSISPGFIQTDNDFSVSLKNLQDKSINVLISSGSNVVSPGSVELNTGQEKQINFELNNPDSLEEITFSFESTVYNFMVFTSSEISLNENESESGEIEFEFNPKTLEVSMATDSEGKRILYIHNTGENEIDEITLEVSPVLETYVELSAYEIKNLDKNESGKIEVSIFSDDEEAIVEGLIIARAGNKSSSLVLVLDFVKDFVPTEGQTKEKPSVKTCENVGGEICGNDFACEGDTFYASDGVCCLGTCKAVSSGGSSLKKWIGWILIVAIFLLIIWFYKFRYKRVGRVPMRR